MPHRLFVLKRIETRLCGPSDLFEHIEHRFGDGRGQRADQLVQPEFPDIIDRLGGGRRRRSYSASFNCAIRIGSS